MAVFSNYTGDNLAMKQLSSHGSGVLSAALDEKGFVSMSGTSMASPQIAGILALYKQAYPEMSNVELVKLISANVERASVND
ncbi:hypothetical protein EBR21_12895 [bacterium]|nr:hypothetical protein [bacterium]